MELPVNVLIGKPINPNEKEHVRELIYNYFDLANEQAYLRAKRRICRHTWTSWNVGICDHYNRPEFKEVYDEIIGHSSFTYLKRLVDSNFTSDPKSWY